MSYQRIKSEPVNLGNLASQIVFSDDNLQAQSSPPKKAKKTYVHGQDLMSIAELEKEYAKAESEEELHLCSSLLTTLIKNKGLDPERRESLVFRKAQLLLQIGAFQDAIDLSQVYAMEANSGNPDIQPQSLMYKCIVGEALNGRGEVWNGYMEVLRAQGLSQKLRQNRVALPFLDEALQVFRERSLSSTRAADFFCVEGDGRLAGLGPEIKKTHMTPLPELRNRMVRSISCGRAHTIILVDGCSCADPFNPKSNCEGTLTCNGGSEVFGWGENNYRQVTGYVAEKLIINPLLLYQFSGQKIVGLCAFENSSAAFDESGLVYEWGSVDGTVSDVRVINAQSPLGKLNQLYRGQNFYVAHDINKRAYIWGKVYGATLKDMQALVFSSDKAKPLVDADGESMFENIAVGWNHVLLQSSSTGRVQAMGDNDYWQLGISARDLKFSKDFVPVEGLDKHNIIYISASKTCSFFVTAQGRVLFSGTVSHKRNSRIAQEVQISDSSMRVIRVTPFVLDSNDNDASIHAMTDLGKCLTWDPDISDHFLTSKLAVGYTFNNFVSCGNYHGFYRSLFKPQKCKIELITEVPRSFEPIQFRISVFDELGYYGIKLFYPIRLYAFVSDRNNIKDAQLAPMARKRFEEQTQQYEKPDFYCIELSYKMCQSLRAVQDRQDVRSYIVEIELDRAEDYYMWILLNEAPLANNPIHFELQQSKEEEKQFEQLCTVEEKRLAAQQEKKRKQEYEMKKKMAQLEQKEFDDQRKKNTEKRADEVLKIFEHEQMLRQKVREMEEKLDACRVGGGFDVIRAGKIKEEYEQFVQELSQLSQKHEKKAQPQPQFSAMGGIGMFLQQQGQQQQQQQVVGKNRPNSRSMKLVTESSNNTASPTKFSSAQSIKTEGGYERLSNQQSAGNMIKLFSSQQQTQSTTNLMSVGSNLTPAQRNAALFNKYIQKTPQYGDFTAAVANQNSSQPLIGRAYTKMSPSSGSIFKDTSQQQKSNSVMFGASTRSVAPGQKQLPYDSPQSNDAYQYRASPMNQLNQVVASARMQIFNAPSGGASQSSQSLTSSKHRSAKIPATQRNTSLQLPLKSSQPLQNFDSNKFQ